MMVLYNKMENKVSLRTSEKFDGEDGDGDISLKLRTQIANELATRLDSELREMDRTGSCESPHPADQTEDCSFRLFSTSDPTKRAENGDQGRRRPVVDSSSDSDAEYERLASVAVSAEQILSGSGLDTKKRKHKKKHKKRKREETENDSENERLTSVAVSAEQILSGSGFDTKKQKRKKRRREETEK